MPVVSFNTSELTVRENETSEVLIHFKILRAGVDLTSRTSVYYQSLSRPHDRATPGEDFALFTSGVCGEGVGCVDFASSQTEVELAVRIIPDTLREGNESFHLYISDVRNGKRGQHELLRITIIDAAQRELGRGMVLLHMCTSPSPILTGGAWYCYTCVHPPVPS